MDKKLKAKWIKALKSGKYKKGDGALKKKVERRYTYCCLGVLCDIVNPNRWRKGDAKNNWDVNYKFESGEQDSGVIPDKDLDKLKIKYHDMRELIQINDCCIDFKDVITYIKTNL